MHAKRCFIKLTSEVHDVNDSARRIALGSSSLVARRSCSSSACPPIRVFYPGSVLDGTVTSVARV